MKKSLEFKLFSKASIGFCIILALTTCNKDEDKKSSLATLTTKTPTSITTNNATVGGFISSDGGSSITERGVCYSAQNQNPSVTDAVITEGSGPGNFDCILSELIPGTKYYVRAFASNAVGTGYGNLVSFTTETNHPPIATFIANPTSGPVPLTVNFTDQSTNSPTSWLWNFGDGGSSNLRNPSHTYNSPGNYFVQLIVSNGSGSDTLLNNDHIIATADVIAPVAAFTANPISGTVPLVVNFSDQSANGPTNWQWSFGDGSTSTQQNPSHTYYSAGTFTVQLTVTNNFGSGTDQKNNYIDVTNSGGSGTVTDIDGNVYQTVVIGTQIWMAENLKVTHYCNGDEIPNVIENSSWKVLFNGAYCWHENDITWINSYGALYNWYAVDDNRGLCPPGWHVPSDDEWTTLINYLGGEDVAGGKMKSTRIIPDPHPRWDLPNTGATNESGLSCLPGGLRTGYNNNGGFYPLELVGYFWSSNEDSFSFAREIVLTNGTSAALRDEGPKQCGLSVRCLKD